MNQLEQYISDNPRNKLVFCLKELEGFEFVDVGYELSSAIKNFLGRRTLSMFAFDKLEHIITNNQHVHPLYGRYIALKNVGILFEPNLRIDIKSLLEQNSKDQLLIIQNKTVPFENIFRLRSDNSKYFVNLSEFRYINITSL